MCLRPTYREAVAGGFLVNISQLPILWHCCVGLQGCVHVVASQQLTQGRWNMAVGSAGVILPAVTHQSEGRCCCWLHLCMQPSGRSTGCVDVALGLSPAETCALGSTCVFSDPFATGLRGQSWCMGIWGAGIQGGTRFMVQPHRMQVASIWLVLVVGMHTLLMAQLFSGQHTWGCVWHLEDWCGCAR